MDTQKIIGILKDHSQDHLIEYSKTLSESEKESLFDSVAKVDFSILETARESKARGAFSPIKVFSMEESEKRSEEFEKAGLAELKKGTFAAVMLAGGQGTRLGYVHPKGCYNLSTTGKEYSLFESHIKDLLEREKKTGVRIPLYIMTSLWNDGETREFFEKNDYFSYGKDNIIFFVQDNAPCTDENGKLLLSSKTDIALSPNGNGGWYRSLYKNCEKDLEKRNIKWISVFSVDNPLHKICNERYVGAVLVSGADAGMKVVKKAYPEENVGVICLENGNPSTVSYSELSDEMRYAKDENGDYLYYYGEIVNFLFKKESLDRTLKDDPDVHVAHKKIPYYSFDGNEVYPESPNGFKYETFAFDLLKYFDKLLPYEVDREKEFAPVKNHDGKDSPDSARDLLRKNGVNV